jgi:hypothetical protein
VRAGQGPPYTPGDGHQETREASEAGQVEDAAVAADRAGKAAREAGRGDGERAQIEEEAEGEVLPWNG